MYIVYKCQSAVDYFSTIPPWAIQIEFFYRNALTCTYFNFGCVFYEQINPQSVFMVICFFS